MLVSRSGHYVDEMTPVKTLRRKDFRKTQLALAKNLASRKQPAAFVPAKAGETGRGRQCYRS